MATGVKFDSTFLTLRIFQYITIRLMAVQNQYHFNSDCVECIKLEIEPGRDIFIILAAIFQHLKVNEKVYNKIKYT